MLQTAHEPSYLVKHLLGNLPPVVERVKLMRKGQAPNGSSEDNFAKMAQSQVAPAPVVCWHPAGALKSCLCISDLYAQAATLLLEACRVCQRMRL